jgi:fructokinase
MRIGVDLGGTKIEALALDESGAERFRKRVPTPSGSYEAIVAALVELIHQVDAACGEPGSVGLGIPGIRSPATGLIKNANTTLLNGHRLDADLERALGRPVRIDNDANCFALSEASDGAASPDVLGVPGATVFGVILGTGTGGGVVVDGRALVGPDAIATPCPLLAEARMAPEASMPMTCSICSATPSGSAEGRSILLITGSSSRSFSTAR